MEDLFSRHPKNGLTSSSEFYTKCKNIESQAASTQNKQHHMKALFSSFSNRSFSQNKRLEPNRIVITIHAWWLSKEKLQHMARFHEVLKVLKLELSLGVNHVFI